MAQCEARLDGFVKRAGRLSSSLPPFFFGSPTVIRNKKAASEATRERLFSGRPAYAGRDELLIALLADFALCLCFDAAGMRAIFAGGLCLFAAGFRKHRGCEEGECQGGYSEEFCDVHSGLMDSHFRDLYQQEKWVSWQKVVFILASRRR